MGEPYHNCFCINSLKTSELFPARRLDASKVLINKQTNKQTNHLLLVKGIPV